jgi:5-methylthioadenosine/S-adenosylhomocysteine deaminase
MLAGCGQDGIPAATDGLGGGQSSGFGGNPAGGLGGANDGGAPLGGGGASSSSTASGLGGSGSGVGGSVGVGGGANCGGSGAGAGPEIVSNGSSGLILRGLVVNAGPSDTPFTGEVFIQGEDIVCVAASCAGSPGASNATVVDTHGLIFPGLIDTHNHILYDIFDEDDWSPSQTYNNHNQWGDEPRYSAVVDAKQYLNGESSPVDLSCELNKYGELKGLIAGTTSIQGSSSPPSNKACYGSLARTIDQSPNGLDDDKIQTATLFPSTSSADGVCTNFADGDTDAYVIHVGEGVDQTALNEFDKLRTITTVDDCLLDPKTTIIHGAAFGDAEFTTMGQNGMSLVWSPRSNVFLYGGGTDTSKTTNVPLARSRGVNIALGPDWSLGGSQNLLDELRYAQQVDQAEWGSSLSAKDLVQMVTVNAAKALGLSSTLGSLTVGKKADIMVISGNTTAPYDALIAATPATVELVIVGGTVLYGNLNAAALGPPSPGCEQIDVCCAPKFICVATTSTNDKFNQTFAEIYGALQQGMEDYDALDLTQWDFAPIAPLVKCQ